MGKTVDLDRVATLARDYSFAFLVTVGDDHRAHTTAVTPSYADGLFDIGPVGRHGWANLTAHPAVTLAFPARDVTEYSLLVDGEAELSDDPESPVRVRPTKALLHRPLPADAPPSAFGAYDCVQLT
ncbi:pyridoxamine 5'-phosphate oxidase family protein [Mycobacterium sp. M1]|uniref:Pyridoxamine 5'-phosphate oxidase family protein n=1 Tax=Mycolicibacter acidiphilus TaxID=2835306 RepID=A0ABS5RGR3_9MYCO|nr:pyridoxamine 5'-phosphate oxidase family protein [Mycolicibacter acidiphilus]MBS9532824.1 pyridoxamine 5'-phosphate oxidase family protein [Mycolicibacter acidiphilus]